MDERHRTSRRRALGILAAAAVSGSRGATAQDPMTEPPHAPSRLAQNAVAEVDLDLVLGVDASGSVNQRRFELQRRGYVEAFMDPRVLAAVRSGPRAAVGVAMYQWTGPRLQIPVVPWTRIHDEATIRQFADRIARADRHLFGGGTSISGAIDYGVFLLGETPFDALRRVIDISGDGANNRGRPAVAARDEAVAAGININGLPILELEPDLEEHYRSNVIGGPGAFTIAADTFDDFGNAIRRKLILEIAGREIGPPMSGAA